MARHVFFSFHYENDVWRANVVRNSWVTKPDRSAAGFIDSADFEELKKKGEREVKKWIDSQLLGTSVTVVLIGMETLQRPFVLYELQESFKRGNGILGVYIDQIKDQNEKTTSRCSIYGIEVGKDSSGSIVFFTKYSCHDWTSEVGYNNLGLWIEAAAKDAGR